MPYSALPTIHVLYENGDWLPPLLAALDAEGFEHSEVHLNTARLDPWDLPADGIWLNRASPSSHTRGHTETVALTRELLHWLEVHGRRVVNGLRPFEIEISKLRQEIVLRRYGIRTPRTVLAVGHAELVAAASTFDGPFLTKHNQGGKGLGIELFDSSEQLDARLAETDFDHGPNRQVILQQFIEAKDPFITRVEIVGGRFLLAMRSSTSAGFELCPSDVCQAERADASATFEPSPLTAEDPLVQRYLELCQGEGIEIAGIEFVEDRDGRRYTYDINGSTNYNAAHGRRIGVDGMREVARYLKRIADQAAVGTVVAIAPTEAHAVL